MANKKETKGAPAPKAAAKPAPAAAPEPPPVAAKPAAPAEAPKAAKPAPAAAEATVAPGEPTPIRPVKTHGFRRKLVGRVTGNKMDKTVTVEVIRNSPDPVYKKYVRQRERYKAHDETNQYKVGDRVEIQEHRPISRDKRWLVIRLISRPVEE
jgi:small subunit ribosomal protein S17